MEHENQEIDLQELLRVIVRKWWLIVLLLTIFSSVAYVYTDYYFIPIYKASTSLFIGKEQNSIANISFTDIQTNNQLITDYRELIKSRMIVDEVVNNLGLNMSSSAVKANLTINRISDSRFFTLSFHHPNPTLATEVANKAAEVLVLRAADFFRIENIQVIDIALVPQTPISSSKLKNIIIASMLGILVSLFIIFFMEFFKNTINTEEDIEKYLGLSVIGVIPNLKEKKLSRIRVIPKRRGA